MIRFFEPGCRFATFHFLCYLLSGSSGFSTLFCSISRFITFGFIYRKKITTEKTRISSENCGRARDLVNREDQCIIMCSNSRKLNHTGAWFKSLNQPPKVENQWSLPATIFTVGYSQSHTGHHLYCRLLTESYRPPSLLSATHRVIPATIFTVGYSQSHTGHHLYCRLLTESYRPPSLLSATHRVIPATIFTVGYSQSHTGHHLYCRLLTESYRPPSLLSATHRVILQDWPFHTRNTLWQTTPLCYQCVLSDHRVDGSEINSAWRLL